MSTVFSQKSSFRMTLLASAVSVLVACGGGGSGGGGDVSDRDPVKEQPEIITAKIAIADIQPQFGLPGDVVKINAEGVIPSNLRIVLNGTEIVPDAVSGGSVTFTIPSGVASGPLLLKGDKVFSNTLWFSVSENGLSAPDPTKVIEDPLGNDVVSDYLIVQVLSSDSSPDTAQRLAQIVSGEVIGQVSELSLWQIAIDVDSLGELEGLRDLLLADPSVENVIIDFLVEEESVDWSKDPGLGQQRDRNNVEQGAAFYESKISLSDSSKVLPYFMAIGVTEAGLDFGLPDFSNQLTSATNKVSIFGKNLPSSNDSISAHGSNVLGIVSAELGDGGNAGLIEALSATHAGANISVSGKSLMQKIFATLEMAERGASVVNWSWGVHRVVATDINNDGSISSDEATDGALNCKGEYVLDNAINDKAFKSYKELIGDLFDKIEATYPKMVIVASAGNGLSDAGDATNRLPSALESNQMIVVGAHTSGGMYDDEISEDDFAAEICFDKSIAADIKRANYSNFGERVDVSASGTIVGFQNQSLATVSGTSYAAPLVTATVALMQSINPNLSALEIKNILRASALPVENKVMLSSGETVFTRPLNSSESEPFEGKGARLNVKGALESAVSSLESETVSKGDLVKVSIPKEASEITKTITVTVPGEGAVFDKVDIMFVVDVSSSYSDDINTFRAKAGELIEAFRDSGNDVHIGISTFSDFPLSPYGSVRRDYAFSLNQPLTNDEGLITGALNGLSLLSGADSPESQLEALAKTSLRDSGWRDGALPILFLATDASFHDSDVDPNYPGTGFSETEQMLINKKMRVYGLQAGGSIPDVIRITESTGGGAFELSRDSEEIVTSVIDALDEVSSDLSIKLVPNGDFTRVVKSIKPAGFPDALDGASIDNVRPGDSISFDVVFEKGDEISTGTKTLTFRLLVNADDVAIIQEIPVVLTID